MARSGLDQPLRKGRYFRGDPGNGWMIAFDSAPLNSVISPTFFPGAGSSLAASGLFHLNASVATSPTIARNGRFARVAWERNRVHAACAHRRVRQYRIQTVGRLLSSGASAPSLRARESSAPNSPSASPAHP